ncbi:MAG: STAS domain-containing protein [Planctomycetes bacterium]|nr:STAS domain-containing protein [Planctomycetota bacterium]
MAGIQIEHQPVPGIPDAAIVRLKGSIDVYTSSGLRMDIERLRLKGAERLILDLAEVSYVNSTGVSYILGLADEGTPERPSLIILNLSHPVRVIFDMMKILPVLKICANVEEAVGVLAGKTAAKAV